MKMAVTKQVMRYVGRDIISLYATYFYTAT